MKNRYLPHKWRRDSTLLGGGFLAHDKQFLILADAFHRHGFGRFLDSVFGGQPCAWHAGRIIDTPIPEDGLEAYLHFILPAYTERGISCRLNFSAPDITPGMLADTKANIMLRVLHEYNINTDKPHGVIVSSDMLREYIREKFPGISITCSVLKTAYERPNMTETPEWYDCLAERFDIVVVRSDRNLDLPFLQRIRSREKMELIINSDCVPNCPLRVEHYQLMLEADRGSRTAAREFETMQERCRRNKMRNADISLTLERIQSLHDAGFRHFKMSGRELAWDYWAFQNGPYLLNAGVILNMMLEEEG